MSVGISQPLGSKGKSHSKQTEVVFVLIDTLSIVRYIRYAQFMRWWCREQNGVVQHN